MIASLASRTSGNTIGTPAWELLVGATPGEIKLLELGVFLVNPTASVLGLGVPAAIGVTPTSPVDLMPENPKGVITSGNVQASIAWGTPPTVPVNYFRRISLPGTAGTGIIWTFPKGLIIDVGNLILWNLTGNSILDVHVVAEV